MTRDFININDFVVLVEEANTTAIAVDSCCFDEPIIGVAFYGSGNVDLTVKYGQNQKKFHHTKGLALSFHADQEVEFEHTISPDKNLKCLVVATKLNSLEHLPNEEGELFTDLLEELARPKDHYVEGPSFFMTPEMEAIVDAFFVNNYSGKTKMMFFRSQITALLSHFFGQLAIQQEKTSKPNHRKQLNKARDILLENIDNPPSLSELSKEIGFNTTKLKKEFKASFGVPVFKYLQSERLKQAYHLIKSGEKTIQEAAWAVGYDSLGSFSNAFEKKFGYRPSQA